MAAFTPAMLLRAIRLIVGLTIMTILTLIVSISALILTPLGLKRVSVQGSRLWAHINYYIVYPIVGLKVEFRGTVEAVSASSPVLVIGNHPRTFEVIGFCRYVAQMYPGRDLIGVIKRELGGLNPFGEGLRAMGTLLIDRAGGKATIDSIQKWAAGLSKHSAAICLFIDGTRGSPEKRAQSRDKLLARISDPALQRTVADICEHTMPPMAGGISAMLAAIPDLKVQLITTCNDRGLDTLGDLIRNPTPTVCVQAVSVVKLPQDRAELEVALLKLWEKEVVPILKQNKFKKDN